VLRSVTCPFRVSSFVHDKSAQYYVRMARVAIILLVPMPNFCVLGGHREREHHLWNNKLSTLLDYIRLSKEQ